MENINLQIAVEDKNYGRALGNALVKIDKRFSVYYEDNIERDNIDMYIFDQEKIENPYEINQPGKENNQKNKLYLVEKESLANPKEYCFFKYENVKQLAKNIIMSYVAMTGNSLLAFEEQRLNTVGVISSSGGTGCSTVAIGMARELVRFYGKKVLYLTFDPFCADYGKKENKSEGEHELNEINNITFDLPNSITEYMYYIEENKPVALDVFLNTDKYGVMSFNYTNGKNPLSYCAKEELINLISSLEKSKIVDTVIFDIGTTLNSASIFAMGLCQKLYCIQGLKDKKYFNYLNKIYGEKDGLLKVKELETILVKNKYIEFEDNEDNEEEHLKDSFCSNIENENANGSIRSTDIGKSAFFIPFDHRISQEGTVELDGDFGYEIKEIMASAGIFNTLLT